MNESDTIQVTVNGDVKQFRQGATVADLIAGMELTGQRIAVELNLEIVPKAEHVNTQLQDNDVLEVVHAIGGG